MRSARCPSCAKNIRIADASAEMMVVCPDCGHSVPTEWDTLAPDPSPATPNYDTLELEHAGLLSPPKRAGELGWLGPYRILDVLGQGGMGVVFRAEDPTLHREVALKTLLPAGTLAPTATDRFLREARAAASVEHEHVFCIYQVGVERGIPFLAMPLLEADPFTPRSGSARRSRSRLQCGSRGRSHRDSRRATSEERSIATSNPRISGSKAKTARSRSSTSGSLSWNRSSRG